MTKKRASIRKDKIFPDYSTMDRVQKDPYTSFAKSLSAHYILYRDSNPYMTENRNRTWVLRNWNINSRDKWAVYCSDKTGIDFVHSRSKNWIDSAIMALYNKIEIEDGVTRSKEEIIADIVLSILNKTDFQ